MPNHVTNMITLKGQKDEILGCLTAIMRDPEQGEEKPNNYEGMGTIDFEKIIPMPKDVYRGNIGPEERKTYGNNNWYDWSVAHWGTKWNAYNTYGHTILPTDDICEGDAYIMEFDTAWDAPHRVIRTLSEMYPEIEFEHLYFDEFLNFAGLVVYKRGLPIRVCEPQTPKEIFELVCSEYWQSTPENEGAVLNMDGTGYVYLSDSYIQCMLEYEGKQIRGLTNQDWSIRKSWVPDQMEYYTVRVNTKNENIPAGIVPFDFGFGDCDNFMSFMVMKDALDAAMIEHMNKHPEKINLVTLNSEGESEKYTTLGEFIDANK